MSNSSTRKRSSRSAGHEQPDATAAKHPCCTQSVEGLRLHLMPIPKNKQTLRRGTKEWPTKKEPPSEVDVLWYKDEGGLQNALSFTVSLAHAATGSPALGHMGTHVKAELLMGRSEVPVDSAKKTQLRLDRLQGCRPVIDANGNCTLRLRITDVSKNHGNVPFRIRLGLADADFGNFLPGIGQVCSELITVRSKRGSGAKPKSFHSISPTNASINIEAGSRMLSDAANGSGGGYMGMLAGDVNVSQLVDRLSAVPPNSAALAANAGALRQTSVSMLSHSMGVLGELMQMHSRLGAALQHFQTELLPQVQQLQQIADAAEKEAGVGAPSRSTRSSAAAAAAATAAAATAVAPPLAPVTTAKQPIHVPTRPRIKAQSVKTEPTMNVASQLGALTAKNLADNGLAMPNLSRNVSGMSDFLNSFDGVFSPSVTPRDNP